MVDAGQQRDFREADMQRPCGRFVWHDLRTTDIEAAIDFFVGLFGWSIQVVDTARSKGGYRVFHANDRVMGGFVALQADLGEVSHWLGYVSVEDLDPVVAASDDARGSQAVSPTEIPQVGRIAVLRDPCGAAFAPLQRISETDPSPSHTGDGEICWNELHSPEPSLCAAYYSAVLGWTADQRPMGPFNPYIVFGACGEDVAGLSGPLVASLPFPVWIPYVRVPDLSQAANRAQQLGGSLWLLPVDISGVGSVAVIADPSGAPTGLFQGSG